MAEHVQNHDEDSFIILGTSPGTSLDIKCNGTANGYASLDKTQLADAMKELPLEASMAFKAHFKLGDCIQPPQPSPASLMVASNIITDDKSTEDLQKRFGEILDENVILKETLKQNNDSLKEQFLLIASCQEDMMKTHTIHKEKFEETRELVEKLRHENKKLKLDLCRMIEPEGPQSAKSEESGVKTGPSSAVEFVTSPDDDTINKLTSQLDLVEKQRRQVIVDNEKLTWQKESLEHIVDATSKERDDLREKLKAVELQVSTKDNECREQLSRLNYTINELQNKLQSADSVTSISSEEIIKRDKLIQQLESKVSALQADLKGAQLKILDLESVKLEFTKYKSGVLESTRLYKEQTQDLQQRLKEAQTVMFQPVRFSVGVEGEAGAREEQDKLAYNVKLYDKTLKHLAELFNKLTHGLSDSLVQSLGAVASLHDYKLERGSAEQVRGALAEVRQQLEKEHSSALNNIGQVKGTMSIFEGIFKDHEQLLKKTMSKQEATNGSNVEALTAALVARGDEIQALRSQLQALSMDKEDKDLLKAQLDLYKSDFEAERESREKMASEREHVLTDLRKTQRRCEELTQQLEEVRKMTPAVYRTAISRKPSSSSSPKSSYAPARQSSTPATTTPSTTGNMVYTCPKCMRFCCDQYKVMEDHFDFCLDDF